MLNMTARMFVGRSFVELFRMHTFPLQAYAKFSLLLKSNLIGGLAFSYYEENKFKINSALRKKIKLEVEGEFFVKLIAKYIPHFIPTTFIEGYSQLEEEARQLCRKKRVRAIISSVGWKDDRFKLYSAIQRERGSKLIGVQHGAYYGQAIRYFDELKLGMVDYFISSGWSPEKSHVSRVYPMPSIRLSKLMNKNKARQKAIVYFSACFDRYRIRLSSYQDPVISGKYYRDQIKMISLLDKEALKWFYYRPYPNELGFEALKRIMNNFPEINSAQRGKGTDWLKRCSLSVMDHPGTAMYEALAINIPSIFFWRSESWPMREESERYFDKLRKVGLLYDLPESAATKVNALYKEDISLWWNQDKIQNARSAFLKRYGYATKGWEKVWAKALKKFMQAECFLTDDEQHKC